MGLVKLLGGHPAEKRLPGYATDGRLAHSLRLLYAMPPNGSHNELQRKTGSAGVARFACLKLTVS